MFGSSEASPVGYHTKTIDELGNDEFCGIRNVLYSTIDGSMLVAGSRAHDYQSSQLRGSEDNILVSGCSSKTEAVSRNATMRAVCNNSTGVGKALGNVLLSVNPEDGSSVMIDTQPESKATGKQKGEFSEANGPSENFIAGRDQIQHFLRKIKSQMKEENIYGKGKTKDDRVNVHGSHTVSEKTQYEIETLARQLGRIPAAQECQQQPYSVSKQKLGGNSISNSGDKYNINFEFMAKRIKARVLREHRKQQEQRSMQIGMSSLEKQLELQEEQDKAPVENVDTELSALSPRAREEASKVLGIPITAEVLGNPSDYGYHGRTMTDMPQESAVKPSLIMQSSKSGGLTETLLSKLGIRTHAAYPKLRSSVFMSNQLKGVYAVDLSKCPAQVADALLLCLQAPVHTLALHCDATAWQRLQLEEKYRVNRKLQDKTFVSASEQAGMSVFSLPSPTRSVQDQKEPYTPYLLSKILSKEIPKKLLAHAPHQQHLELQGLTLTPTAWVSIVQALMQMPKLRVLYIRQCNFNEAALATLIAVLAKQNVAHVSLQGCGLGPAAGYAVERLIGMQADRRDQVQWRMCLRNYKSYQKLDIPIDHAEERQVSEKQQNLGLLSLDVSHNRLGDEAVSRILSAVTSDQWMLHLDVSANGADEQSIIALVEALALNSTILHIKLENTVETEALVDSLDPILPLRCVNRLRWYSRPGYLGQSSDTKQQHDCYVKYQKSMQKLPDWLLYTDLSTKDKQQLQNMPCPEHGSNGGRLVYPVLDLVCDISDCLHPLSHIRSNNAMKQGKVANELMGNIYREGIFYNNSNIQKMQLQNVSELSSPLPQHHVKKIIKGKPVVATKQSKDGQTVVDVPLLMHEQEALVREERRVRHVEEMKEKDAATQNLWMGQGKKKKYLRKPNLTVVRKIHGIEDVGVTGENELLQSNAHAQALASPYWSNVIDALDAVVTQRKNGNQTKAANRVKPRVGGGFVVPETTKAREHTRIHTSRKAPVPKVSSVKVESPVKRANTLKYTNKNHRRELVPDPTYDREQVRQTLGLTKEQEQYLSSNNALKNPILAEALDTYLTTSKDDAVYANMYLRALSDTMNIHPKQQRDLKVKEQDDQYAHELMQYSQVNPLQSHGSKVHPKQTGAFDVQKQLERYVHNLEAENETPLNSSYAAPPIDDKIYSIEDVQDHEYQAVQHEFYPEHTEKQYLEALQMLKQYERNIQN